LAGDRNSILVAGALLGHEFGLATASGVTSGLFRTRDVPVDFSDIPPAPTNVRYRGKADMTLTLDNVR